MFKHYSAVQGSFNRFPNITGMAPNLTQFVSSIDFPSQPGYWSNDTSVDYWAAVVSDNTLLRQTHAHRSLSVYTIAATQADLSYKWPFRPATCAASVPGFEYALCLVYIAYTDALMFCFLCAMCLPRQDHTRLSCDNSLWCYI